MAGAPANSTIAKNTSLIALPFGERAAAIKSQGSLNAGYPFLQLRLEVAPSRPSVS